MVQPFSIAGVDPSGTDKNLQQIRSVEDAWDLPALPDEVKLDLAGRPDHTPEKLNGLLWGLHTDLNEAYTPPASVSSVNPAIHLATNPGIQDSSPSTPEVAPGAGALPGGANQATPQVADGTLTADLRRVWAGITGAPAPTELSTSAVQQFKMKAVRSGVLPSDTPIDDTWRPELNSALYDQSLADYQRRIEGEHPGALSVHQLASTMDKWLSPSGLISAATTMGFIPDFKSFGNKWADVAKDPGSPSKWFHALTGTVDKVVVPLVNDYLLVSGVGEVAMFSRGLALGKEAAAASELAYATKGARFLSGASIATDIDRFKEASFLSKQVGRASTGVGDAMQAWRELPTTLLGKKTTQQAMRLGFAGRVEDLFGSSEGGSGSNTIMARHPVFAQLGDLFLVAPHITRPGFYSEPISSLSNRSKNTFIGLVTGDLSAAARGVTGQALIPPMPRVAQEATNAVHTLLSSAGGKTAESFERNLKEGGPVKALLEHHGFPDTPAGREAVGHWIATVSTAAALDLDASARTAVDLGGASAQYSDPKKWFDRYHLYRNKSIAQLREIDPEVPGWENEYARIKAGLEAKSNREARKLFLQYRDELQGGNATVGSRLDDDQVRRLTEAVWERDNVRADFEGDSGLLADEVEGFKDDFGVDLQKGPDGRYVVPDPNLRMDPGDPTSRTYQTYFDEIHDAIGQSQHLLDQSDLAEATLAIDAQRAQALVVNPARERALEEIANHNAKRETFFRDTITALQPGAVQQYMETHAETIGGRWDEYVGVQDAVRKAVSDGLLDQAQFKPVFSESGRKLKIFPQGMDAAAEAQKAGVSLQDTHFNPLGAVVDPLGIPTVARADTVVKGDYRAQMDRVKRLTDAAETWRWVRDNPKRLKDFLQPLAEQAGTTPFHELSPAVAANWVQNLTDASGIPSGDTGRLAAFLRWTSRQGVDLGSVGDHITQTLNDVDNEASWAQQFKIATRFDEIPAKTVNQGPEAQMVWSLKQKHKLLGEKLPFVADEVDLAAHIPQPGTIAQPNFDTEMSKLTSMRDTPSSAKPLGKAFNDQRSMLGDLHHDVAGYTSNLPTKVHQTFLQRLVDSGAVEAPSFRQQMDQNLAKAGLPEEFTVFRGAGNTELGDYPLVSVSLHPDTANGFGKNFSTPAAYKISRSDVRLVGHPGEEELIVPSAALRQVQPERIATSGDELASWASDAVSGLHEGSTSPWSKIDEKHLRPQIEDLAAALKHPDTKVSGDAAERLNAAIDKAPPWVREMFGSVEGHVPPAVMAPHPDLLALDQYLKDRNYKMVWGREFLMHHDVAFDTAPFMDLTDKTAKQLALSSFATRTNYQATSALQRNNLQKELASGLGGLKDEGRLLNPLNLGGEDNADLKSIVSRLDGILTEKRALGQAAQGGATTAVARLGNRVGHSRMPMSIFDLSFNDLSKEFGAEMGTPAVERIFGALRQAKVLGVEHQGLPALEYHMRANSQLVSGLNLFGRTESASRLRTAAKATAYGLAGAGAAEALGADPREALGAGVISALGGATVASRLVEATRKPILNSLEDKGWLHYTYLADNLAQTRDWVRFALNPMFDARRWAKGFVLSQMTEKPGDIALPARLSRRAFVASHGEQEWEKTATAFKSAARGDFGSLDDVTDVEHFFTQEGLLGYNPTNRMISAYGHLLKGGVEPGEAYNTVRKIYTYGTTGRSPLELSANFLFFPFSFEKKLVSTAGKFLSQDLSRAMVLHDSLKTYSMLNEKYNLNQMWKDHLPVLQDLQKLNAFAHGISPGQLGGVNRNLWDAAHAAMGSVSPVMNLFLPQAVNIKSSGEKQQLLDIAKGLIPATTETKFLLDDLKEQGHVVYGYASGGSGLTRQGEINRGWETWDKLRTGVDQVAKENGAEHGIQTVMRADRYAPLRDFVKQQRSKILDENPAWAASRAAGSARRSEDQQALEHMAYYPKNEAETAAVKYNELVQGVQDQLQQQGISLTEDPELVPEQYFTVMRGAALELAHQYSGFDVLYKRFFRRSFGPLEAQI